MSPRRITLAAGPWRGVRSTTDPFDDQPNALVDAQNIYIPDPSGGSSLFARPGFSLQNSAAALAGRGQCVYHHTALSGTEYNFFFAGGKVYRADAAMAMFTDVTPTGVLISQTHRIWCATLGDKLVVTDGVNTPWYGTNLASTPITGTYINYDSQALVALLAMDTGNNRQLKTAQFAYNAGGAFGNKAPQTGIVVATKTLTANRWGLLRFTIDNTGGFTQMWAASDYATEVAAIAAIPAVPAGAFDMGYVTVQANAAATWTAQTDAFQGGTGGTPAQTTNYHTPLQVDPWNAYGPPAIYSAHLFFILGTWSSPTATTVARSSIVWSEASDPTTGYEQTNYDNSWTLSQTAADPLYGLAPTDVALYYFRRTSVGAIAGDPGVGAGMRTTATHEAISTSVGCVAPATIQQYGNAVFFCDQLGRPFRISPQFQYAIESGLASGPEPIWMNMRQYVQDSLATAGMNAAIETVAIGAVDPYFDLYLCAPYSANAAATASPTTLYAFDAKTGAYVGRWSVGGGFLIDAIGVQKDANVRPTLAVIGAKVAGAGAATGYVWILNGLDAAVWQDNGAVPTITAQTQRMGYSANQTYYADVCRAIVGSTAPCTVTAETPYTASTVEATPTPTTSSDGRSRLTAGLDIQGRGVQITLSPTTAASQWALDRIEIDAVPSLALPDDY